MSNISLYCLPYSGGSAAMYYKWRNVNRPGNPGD